MKPNLRGFSLVELMISLVIGLVLVLAAGQMYLANKLAFEDSKRLSHDASILNFATNVIMKDFKMGQFYVSSGDLEGDVDRLTVAYGSGIFDEVFCPGSLVMSKEYFLGVSQVSPEGSGNMGIYVQPECRDPDVEDGPVLVFDSVPAGGLDFRVSGEFGVSAIEVDIDFYSERAEAVKRLSLLVANRSVIVGDLQP